MVHELVCFNLTHAVRDNSHSVIFASVTKTECHAFPDGRVVRKASQGHEITVMI